MNTGWVSPTGWSFESARDGYYFWINDWPICRIRAVSLDSWQVTGDNFEMIVHGSDIKDIKNEAELTLRDFGFNIPSKTGERN